MCVGDCVDFENSTCSTSNLCAPLHAFAVTEKVIVGNIGFGYFVEETDVITIEHNFLTFVAEQNFYLSVVRATI